jgi:uncharacterized repeat protein (TIGR04044 family)
MQAAQDLYASFCGSLHHPVRNPYNIDWIIDSKLTVLMIGCAEGQLARRLQYSRGAGPEPGAKPKECNMPAVTMPARQKGDYLVDYESKVFEDVKAKPGEKALVTFHTVAFEGSIGFVNMLQATRLMRKGFETSILLYGPGVTLGVQRGFPKIGDEAFPGHQNFNNTLVKFMAEGGKVYACRFALQALYGHGEPSLIPGIIPISPLDVLDLTLLHRNENAFMLHTWTL